jgi:DNA-binding NtrC family response regulator
LDSNGFDLIIVSQGSRDFEGRCVLERATEIDRRLPVLVIARCLDMHCYLEAIQLGAVDYLAEPVPAAELGRLVANHSRSHSAA